MRLNLRTAALSKKLWNPAYTNPSLKDSSAQDIHKLFPEEAKKYEKMQVTDLLVIETDAGVLTGVRFYFWIGSEGYAIGGGYAKVGDHIIFKVLETEDEAKKQGSSGDRPVYRKLDKEIESILNKSHSKSELPADLLNTVAPQLKNFEVPETVKSEKERDKIMNDLLKLWEKARADFLDILPKSSQAIVGAEITSRILSKRSKNPYAKEFFESVAVAFVEIQDKIKKVPRDSKKEIRDEASGFAVGDKVEFQHPQYGRISGTIAEFKDGKVGIRHKNYARLKYVVVGTEITFVDASGVKYAGPWRGPSTPASKESIKAVETALKKITNALHTEIVSYYEGFFSEQVQNAIKDIEDISGHRQNLLDVVERNATKRIKTSPSKYEIARLERLKEEETQRINMMKHHEVQWDKLRKSHSEVEKYFTETPNESLAVVDDLDRRISNDAKVTAVNIESTFVEKQLSKLSSIIDKRKDFSSVVIDGYKFSKGALEADLVCKFGEDSFVAHTILVYTVNSQGTPFYRYPTTFHDVVLDGVKSKKADERWMNEVFAKTKKEASLVQTISELERLTTKAKRKANMIDTKNFDLGSYCQKLVEFVRAGRITKKQQVHQILATGRVTTHQFVDWFFDSLGKLSGKSRTTYDDLAKLIDMDVFPRTFAIRKLDFVDKMDLAPKYFQERYAAVHYDIDTLAQKLSCRRKNS